MEANNKSNYIRILSSSVLAFMSLVIWRQIYDEHCAALVIPLAIILFIAFQAAEFGIAKRYCFANCFLPEGSFFYRMITGRVLTIFISILVSIITGAVLVLNFITWDFIILSVLAIDALFLCILFLIITYTLRSHIKPKMGKIAVKHLTVMINTTLLLAVLVAIQLNTNIPEYIDKSSLTKTIENASKTVSSNCEVINTLTKLNTEKEAVTWWLMFQVSKNSNNPTFRWAAWLLFLLSSSLSVWAYSRFLVQVIDFVHIKE